VLGREDLDLHPLDQQLAGQGVDLDDPLDLVTEELDPDRDLLVGGEDLQRVAADPNEPRTSVMSLRSYWMSIRWRTTLSRRVWPPARRETTVLAYSSGEPRP
jgi:hypothetical protein